MQHGVRPRPLLQAADRFFTFFFLLNRASSTVQVGRIRRTLNYPRLHSTGNARQNRSVSDEAREDFAQQLAHQPTNSHHVQTNGADESRKSLRQEMAMAGKHAKQAQTAAKEAKMRYRNLIRSERKKTTSQARRQDQKIQESGKPASTNKITRSNLSQVKNAGAALDRAMPGSSIDALQDKLNHLFRKNIGSQAATTDTEGPTVTGVVRHVTAASARVKNLGTRGTDSKPRMNQPVEDKAPSHPLSDTQYENVPTSTKLVGLLRHMPNSVVVVTALAPSSNSDSQEQNVRAVRGMTASSFTCVSMERDPVISFNVKQPSRTLQAIQSGREFVVHILDGGPHGALIADAFTAGDADAGFHRIALDPIKAKVHTPPLPDIRHNSVVATLYCELREPEVVIQDHAVVFGTVKRINVIRSKRGATEEELYQPFCGLLYQNQAYRAIGKLIIDPKRLDVKRS